MLSASIAAVMVHVPAAEASAALDWYQSAFPASLRFKIEEQDFEFLQVGPTRIEVVSADEKVSFGPSGTIVYWRVDDVAMSAASLEKIGATLYRGPMNIENGQVMCQLQDPWGNCIGLRGPSRPTVAFVSPPTIKP